MSAAIRSGSHYKSLLLCNFWFRVRYFWITYFKIYSNWHMTHLELGQFLWRETFWHIYRLAADRCQFAFVRLSNRLTRFCACGFCVFSCWTIWCSWRRFRSCHHSSSCLSSSCRACLVWVSCALALHFLISRVKLWLISSISRPHTPSLPQHKCKHCLVLYTFDLYWCLVQSYIGWSEQRRKDRTRLRWSSSYQPWPFLYSSVPSICLHNFDALNNIPST